MSFIEPVRPIIPNQQLPLAKNKSSLYVILN